MTGTVIAVAVPTLDRHIIDDLTTLRFVEEAANVLLVGPPEVGKTMLARSLARKPPGHLPVEAECAAARF